MTLTLETIKKLIAEASIYNYLATVFRGYLEPVLDGRFYRAINKAVELLDCSELKGGLEGLRSLSNEWSFKDLKSEYTRLFIRSECQPYETAYLVENPYGKNAVLADIAGFYLAFGVKPKDEMPDFISCELEFVGLLCFKEGYALASDQKARAQVCSEAQKKFIDEHLGRWVKPFSVNLMKCCKIPLYTISAEFTRRFVEYHAKKLGLKLKFE